MGLNALLMGPMNSVRGVGQKKKKGQNAKRGCWTWDPNGYLALKNIISEKCSS